MTKAALVGEPAGAALHVLMTVSRLAGRHQQLPTGTAAAVEQAVHSQCLQHRFSTITVMQIAVVLCAPCLAVVHARLPFMLELAAVYAGGVMLRDNNTQEVHKLDLSGLFFAIGHAPATKFLKKQLELDEYGYIVTKPDSTATSVPGVCSQRLG